MRVTRGAVGPALNPREEPLRPRPVALDPVVAAIEGVATGARAVVYSGGNQVFGAGQDKYVRAFGVRVSRQPLVGLSGDRRRQPMPNGPLPALES